MKRKLTIITIACIMAMLASLWLYLLTNNAIIEALWITLLTMSYHIVMRELVAFIVNHITFNEHHKHFREKKWEPEFYKFIRIREWKDHLPTYRKEDYLIDRHHLRDVILQMCRSEAGHEADILLSFVPLLFSIWFHQFHVFLATSLIAAAFDLIFVFIQRYNRPRIEQLYKRYQKRK